MQQIQIAKKFKNELCQKIFRSPFTQSWQPYYKLWSEFYGNEVVCNSSVDTLHVILSPIPNHDCRRQGLMK